MHSLLLRARVASLFLTLCAALTFGWATWKTPGIPHAPFLSYALIAALASAYGVFIGVRSKRYIPWLGNALVLLIGVNATTGLVINGALAISALPAFIAIALLLGDRMTFIAFSLWLLALAAYVLFWQAAAPEVPTASRSFLSTAVIAVTVLLFYRMFGAYVKEREASQAELERAQSVARLGSFAMTGDQERLSFSKETARLFDLSERGEARFEDLLARVHPDDRVAVDAAWRAALRGARFDQTYRITVRGQTIWVRGLADLELDPYGRLVKAVGTVQDITELRRVEMALDAHRNSLEEMVASRTAELQLATERLQGLMKEQQTILDNASVSIMLLKDNRLAWCNQSVCDVLGYDSSELAGKPTRFIYDAGSEEDYQRAVEESLLVLARGDRLVKEVQGKRKDGKRLWGQVSAQAVNPGDPLAGIIVCVEDITERKAMQARMDELIREQQTILDNATVGITHTKERVMVWANPQLARMFGYEIDELKGRSVEILYANHADYQRIGEEGIAALARGEQFQTEVQGKRKDGTLIWVRVSTQCLDTRNPAQDLIVCVEDHTEIKQNRQQLEQARLVAEAGSRAKSEFLANMSHEIRTPLNGVLGLAAIIRRAGLSERQLDLMGRLESSGHHLLEMLDDILDMSKIEAGRLEIHSAPVNLIALAANLESIVRDQVAAKHLALAIETGNLPNHLGGDEVRLRQAWLNLLANAIKFTEEGRIILRVSPVEEDETSALVRFEVEDTGIGIAEDLLPHLFANFQQADNSRTRKYGGTGLGLALVRRLAGLMGGEAGASSTEGVGSRFWFTARLSKGKAVTSEESQPISALDALITLRTENAGWRVLVAEDEPVNRLVAEALLTDAGLIVDLAGTGQEVVEKAKTNGYDLILMDMQMPDMDGLQATREIREALKLETPIIAVTANAFEEDRQACLKAGMNDFMTKPFADHTLYTTVLRWLASR